jgi:hypothetical protein
MNPLAEAELAAQPWPALRTISGTAEDIPDALRALANAVDDSTAQKAYWTIDNRVVVQGHLFSSARAVLQVILAMLCGPLPVAARRSAVDLLLQIGGGAADMSEIELGNRDLGDRCRKDLSLATWKIYELTLDEDNRIGEAALELVVLIEPDKERLERMIKAIASDRPTLRPFSEQLLDEEFGN